MKALYHIILIILIAFFSSTFVFSLSPIDYNDSIVIDEPKEKAKLTLALDGDNNLKNPTNIIVKHTADKTYSLVSLPKNIFTVTIYQGDKVVSDANTKIKETTITISDKEVVVDKENPLSTTIELSQKNLNLKDGSYKIVLKSGLISDDKSNTITLNVSYDSGFKYYEAQSTPQTTQTGFTIYYPDKSKSVLVPVTRFVDMTLSMNKQVINELQQAPVDTNLINGIDKINYCVYKNNNLYIDVPADNEYYKEGSDISSLAFKSMYKSMMNINAVLPIDYVYFTADKASITGSYEGIQLDTKIETTYKPSIYLGYKLGDRMYLVDNDVPSIDLNADTNAQIDAILNCYKQNSYAKLYSPFDNNIEIASYTVNGTNLVLNMSDKLLSAYEGNVDKRKFLIDSLVYSFTSLGSIDSVTIRINDAPVQNFYEGKATLDNLVKPNYINPETVQ